MTIEEHASQIKVGTKIIFDEIFVDRIIQHEGIVTEVLDYNHNIGIPHYMVDGYPHPIGINSITQIIEEQCNRKY